MEVDFLFVVIVLATFTTAFLSSIFGMLGGLILMGILDGSSWLNPNYIKRL